MDDRRWEGVALGQHGVVARRQLRALGVTEATVRHHLRLGRWAERTPTVLTTTTGPLSWEQRLWVAVLHTGPSSMLGGLSAAEVQGLRHWHRDDVTVLVDDELSFDPIPGLRVFRTRRPFQMWRAPGRLPVCRIEPALLLFAGYDSTPRVGQGAVAAAVQQRLSTPERFGGFLAEMKPLRRSRHLRALLEDLAGGAHSGAEIDVRRACRRFGLAPPRRQQARVDREGRKRWTDCEWDLSDGRTLVLEVDGAFHLEVRHYTSDLRRQRKLTTLDRVVIRCSAQEIREDPGAVIADLIALGVPRVAA